MADEPQDFDPFLPIGTKVRYDGLDEGGPEFGVVIHCWRDETLGLHDCYVAFFGSEMPTGKPDAKPYVLKYSTGSLTVVE